jgi:chromosome segregation ATPase
MKAEAVEGGRLEAAAQKLDRAITMLEQRLAKRLAEAGAHAGDLFDLDRTNLAAELDACRARERELEEAAAQASEALDRAIAEIKAQIEPGAA